MSCEKKVSDSNLASEVSEHVLNQMKLSHVRCHVKGKSLTPTSLRRFLTDSCWSSTVRASPGALFSPWAKGKSESDCDLLTNCRAIVNEQITKFDGVFIEVLSQ